MQLLLYPKKDISINLFYYNLLTIYNVTGSLIPANNPKNIRNTNVAV